MIIGIEGGIGTGKTVTLVYFMLKAYDENKMVYTNVHLKKVAKHKVKYVDKDFMKDILARVKDKSLVMKNSIVGLQEIHNYMDSRNAMSTKNKIISYWILQSRHTGQGSCDIVYDTQDIGQVDLRLRRNTDMIIRPTIVVRDKKGGPASIYLDIQAKVGHKVKHLKKIIDVQNVLNRYDTHEVVEI